MNANHLLGNLIGIKKPFSIKKAKITPENKKLRLWVTSERTLFNKKDISFCPRCENLSNNIFSMKNLTWYHLKVGGYITEITASIPIYAVRCNTKECGLIEPWFSPPKSKLSYALTNEIIKLISQQINYSYICDYFKLPLNEIWAIKHQFDSGSLKIDPRGSLKRIPDRNKNAGIKTILPPSSQMVWKNILSKSSSFKTSSLSLKLMLTKIKTQVENMDDENSKDMKINELRYFFLKHKKVLRNEISQILEMSNE